MEPLTRKDLQHVQCQVLGCTHDNHGVLFLHAGCHMRAGTEVSYNLVTGVLTINCKQCKKLIAKILVAMEK